MRYSKVTQSLVEGWRAGEARAQTRAHDVLRAKFFYVALGVLRHYHDAEEAFEDAFRKLDAQVRSGGVQWRGEGPFCSFARNAVERAAVDLYRKLHSQAAQYELEHRKVCRVGDDELAELVDRTAGEDWLEAWEEAQLKARREAEMKRAMEDYFGEEFNERDWRFWKAYMTWAKRPGADLLGAHEKTRFLKDQLADLGLSDNAFYTAKCRFEAKLKAFWKRWRQH